MAIQDTLKQLFSKNIIITRKNGLLKAYDVKKTQTLGAASSRHTRNRWYSSRYNGTGADGYSSGQTAYDIEAARLRMYGDYEVMDSDAIIHSALDIYSDTVTTRDALGNTLTIATDNDEIKKILYNLFYDVLNIDFNMWSWARELCKFGDYFLKLTLNEKYGIVDITPIHPAMVVRTEEMDESGVVVTKYKVTSDSSSTYVSSPNDTYEDYEIIHFRLLSDNKYLPYGRSVIEAARKEYKKLSLYEDAMLLQRIMRAPERRIFKVDIGSIPPNEVDQYMADFISAMKKVPYIDPQTGDYNLKFNLQNMLEDFYLPVRGNDSGTSIDTLQGLQSENFTQDVEYSKNKLLAALKIPKAWLGYDEALDSKASNVGLDIRFASTVDRIQRVISSELYKMATIHLRMQGYDSEDLISYSLELANSSTIRKRQDIDLLNEKMNLANNMLESKLFSKKRIYEQIFDLSESEWKAELDLVIEDAKDAFRLKQIEDEGNDVKLSKVTFGTPHDLVSMQRASDPATPKILYGGDARVDNPGRPEEYGTYGTDDDDAFGRDPTGEKALTVKK